MSGEQIKPGYKRTEVGVIPEDWSCCTVSDLSSSVANAIVGGPFGSDLVSTDYISDGVPVIRGQNMGANVLEGPYAYVAAKKADALAANIARPGDVIFTQRGTLGQVSLVPFGSFDRYMVSQSQMKATLNSNKIDAEFIFYWFSSQGGQKSIIQSAIQTGVPHINLGILKTLKTPVPSKSEQIAVVASLSEIDALLTQLDQLIAKKRDLKQAAMQQLLTGHTRLPGFSEEWVVKRLGDVLAHLGNGAVYEPTSSFGLPVTRIETISDGAIDFSRVGYAVPTDELKKYKLKRGDVLFSHINSIDHIGKVAIYESDADLYHGMNLLLLRPADMIESRYLFYWLGSRQGRKQSATLAKQAVSQASINTVELKGIEVPLPTVSEQTAIVTILSDMDTELATLEFRRDKTRAIKQGMMQELLTGRIRLA